MKYSHLENIICECIKNALFESTQNLVDNFGKIANMINLTDPDQFFFIQLMVRWKDNKDKGMVKKTDGTYHAGAEYGNYSKGTAFKVRSAQELMNLKPQIVKWCNDNNGRAYITCNPRSDNDINNFISTYKSRFSDPNDPRIQHAEEILAGQAKGDDKWATERPRFFFDVDTTDKRIWGITRLVLSYLNIQIEDEYVTPSEGLHIIIADRNVKDMNKAIYLLRLADGPLLKHLFNGFNFDSNGDVDAADADKMMNVILKTSVGSNAQRCFPNKGRFQLIHANFDGKLILYSNVITAGY